MRTLFHAAIPAALLVGLLPVAGVVGSAAAADLEPYYEPEPGPPPVAVVPPPPPPVAVLPPPQVPIAIVPPPCGPYRPCFGRFARGFGPAPGRFYPPPYYAYGKPAYAPVGREGYGYDYDRDLYEGAHRHGSRYGYDGPREEFDRPRRYEPGRYGPRGDAPGRYERRERVERFQGGGRPYADPLGYDRPRGERFDRGPRGEPGPYDRG